MFKKISFFLIFILTTFQLIFGESNTTYVTNKTEYTVKSTVKENKSKVEEFLKQREKKMKKLSKENKESSLRRFEIIFLSSGTVIYLSSRLFLKLFAEFTTGTSSELPDEYWYYIAVNSVGVGLYIAVKDYYAIENSEKKVENLNKKNYKLSLLKVRF